MRRFNLRSERLGVSEAATTFMSIPISPIAELAFLGYYNTQVGTSRNQSGQAVGENTRYLQEKLSATQLAFSPGVVGVCLRNIGRVH